MRDKNIFIRNENWFSLFFRGGASNPVFARVIGTFKEGADTIVMYTVDYPVKKQGRWQWHYKSDADSVARDSGTYTATLAHFRHLFRPDLQNIYGEVQEAVKEEAKAA